MAAPAKGSGAPSSVAEGLHNIAMAISSTMTAPDAGPHLQLLEALQKAVVGAIQGPPPGQGGKPGGPPGAGGPPPGGMAGGGTNIQQLMGGGAGGPQPPSAGPTPPGASGGPSPSGMSADDLRRAQAAMAGTAG